MAQQKPGGMLYKEWRVSKDNEAERPTSGDNGSYPSTNPNSNPNPDPNPTSCCYDNAAGKPPRQPQRLIPPTVEEVRAYATQRGDPPEPTPTAPVGAATSRPGRQVGDPYGRTRVSRCSQHLQRVQWSCGIVK